MPYTDDLCSLEVLDEETILETLRHRYEKDRYYTYIGDILIAFNPCKPLNVFSEKHHNNYKNVLSRMSKPPHLFWVADRAYRNMVDSGQNQCILVSGESGAGKTESTKYIIRHLMHVSPSVDKQLLDKIVKVNPLLEAFGNAATKMNNNSSRFGKFIELHYNDHGTLLGAKIDDYILEKSRVVHRSAGEKNFHIFYALFAGMSRDRLLYYFLEDPDSHRIMRDADPTKSVYETPEEFQHYQRMFGDLTCLMFQIGFTEEHLTVIYIILASILHLANIVFLPCEDTDGVTVADEYPLAAVVKLLGIENEMSLTEALISNVNTIKGERIQSWKTLREANDGRDALSKELYARLFGWIVGQVNRNLWPENSEELKLVRGPSIGLLDMSGFENFHSNCFDQFLINISNERLQQYFMDYIFPREQKEYELEGVEWADINYRSNDGVLDLVFSRPHGILSLLDEESHFPQSTDSTFVHKLNKYCSKSDRYLPLRSQVGFGIQHYAEKVMYDANGFLERNRDNLSQDLMLCLQQSNNDFVKDLFMASLSATGTISHFASKYSGRPKLPLAWPVMIEADRLKVKLSREASLKIKRRGLSGDSIPSMSCRASPTVNKHLKRSLSDLMAKLSQAQPLFVRCLKPNKNLSPAKFDITLVRRQLLCNGLMEIAQLRRDGYPIRVRYEDFAERFSGVCDEVNYDADFPSRCKDILRAVHVRDYRQGRSKLFLKMWHKEQLETALKEKIKEREFRRQSQASLLTVMSEGTTEPDYYHSTLGSLDSGNASSDTIHTIMEANRGKRMSVPNLLNVYPTPEFSKRRMTMANISGDLVGGSLDRKLFPTNLSACDTDSRRLSVTETLEQELSESVSMVGTDAQSLYNSIGEVKSATDGEHRIGEDGNAKEPLPDPEVTCEDESVESDKEDEDDLWRPYDVFQVSERDFEDNDSIFNNILKVIRLFLYLLLVTCILGGTVSSRLSLLLITSGIRDKDMDRRGESMVILLFCICVPIAWNWLMAFMKILFGGKDWPSIKTVFIVTILELLQTCGYSLFVFKVLPNTNFFWGIILTFAMFQIPSLLNVIITEKKLKPEVWDCLKIFCAVIAFVTQFGAVCFFTMTTFITDGKNIEINGDNDEDSKQTEVTFTQFDWQLPVSLVLVSIGWWENFLCGDWSIFGKVKVSFKQWRSVLHEVRETTYFLVGPLKIGLAILLARFLTKGNFVLPMTDEDVEDKSVHHLTSYSLMYLQIGSGIVVTYLAGMACKLHMQKTAFALPLLLSTPISLMLVYLQYRFHFLPSNWHVGAWCFPEEFKDMALYIPLGCAGILWISYCFIVSHVWFPECERMAKIEKLFVTPHYDGIFPDFNLTMRRRCNDKEVRSSQRLAGEGGKVDVDDYVTPMVYVCATMWHETRQEMTQLLKSLFRLDYMHCASKLAQQQFHIRDPDYFDLEIHVIFDDSFELDEEKDKFVPNSFVCQLMEVMEDAARSVVKGPITIPSPEKVNTPYGGRLVWTMPGQTKLIVHCKNKNKIRHRKRWSQCMYLYYLLGFRLLGGKGANKQMEEEHMEEEKKQEEGHVRNRKKNNKKKSKKKPKGVPLKTLLMRMPPDKYEKILQKAESTYILTLDGDVDFRPGAVKLLIDRMKKNRKVGAVCGRIHPIGSGPMVWYQQFEYAIGHWLQKAAEHVFGCVLCCPGCFSLFRGSALMDDNVMKMYTTKPTEARHYIQFEQGEDRWLCTLLLQQGHRIDYCAGADALTFAPETFNEFFNQRRRWSPSTLANMMDLLSSWKDTVRLNDNISRPYILYQFILMASTILAPSTVILMITGSYHSVLGIGVWWSYLLSMAPVALYIFICMTQKSNIQIGSAAVLTAIYTVVMMIATVGTIISIATENFNSPNVVFLSGLTAIFIIAGLLHPQEFFCLVYGALYFMVVPSTFILLTVFYLCNLNNVSWGTREVPKKLTPEEAEIAAKAEEEKQRKKSKSFFSILGLMTLVQELRDVIKGLMGLRNEMENANKDEEKQEEKNTDKTKSDSQDSVRPEKVPKHPSGWEPDPDNPYWLQYEKLGNGGVDHIDEDETEFWKYILKKYLHPLDEDKSHKQKIKDDLLSLRNNVVFIYLMLNFLWTIITLQLQTMEAQLKTFYIISKYEPLSLIFLSVFAIALALQFSSMFIHRWGTFLHLMSSTRIDWLKKTHTEEDFARFVINETRRLQTLEPDLEPDPDYGDDDDDNEDAFTSTFSDTNITGDELSLPDQDYYETVHHVRDQTIRRLRNPSRTTVPLLQTIFEQNLKTMQNLHKYKHGTLAARNSGNRLSRSESHNRRVWPRAQEFRDRLYSRNNRNDYDDDRFTGVRIV
ncbi:uncharacterized protein LOC124134072 [Haliotis rufescens]|uniref:uncharacterized protein LOC124134072 n=1 Tax=Haliotis rufescens TaxID=6454 RepID=UPI00201F3C88|nr:uncharacterized protein LOC124134072 [Haliotis rufescens]XP_048256025.1 uncharacterized protein LOC124134072 [Haliotis rufescens]